MYLLIRLLIKLALMSGFIENIHKVKGIYYSLKKIIQS